MSDGTLTPVSSSATTFAPWQRVLLNVLWPLALLTFIHRTVILGVNGAVTNDFGTVYAAARRFLDGSEVYIENLLSVDPHYLYAPSATVLLSPFAMFDNYTHARWLFIGLSAVCVLIAVWLLLKMFDVAWNSYIVPAVYLGVFLTEAVTNTLIFTNINGGIFLCQVAFFYLLYRRRLWWSGVPMGLSLAIKPMLLPLLIIPVLRRQWQPFVLAAAIPLLALSVGFVLTRDPAAYVSVVMPYMSEVRNYYNSSISGVGVYFGMPSPLILVLRLLVVLVAIVAVYLLLEYRHNHELLWMLSTSGVVLTAVFLVSTLGQMYYSMLLIPTMLTVIKAQSFVRNAPAWIAAYGFFTMDSWASTRWPSYGRLVDTLLPTLGWALLLATITAVLLWRYLDPRRRGRIAAPRSIGSTAGVSSQA